MTDAEEDGTFAPPRSLAPVAAALRTMSAVRPGRVLVVDHDRDTRDQLSRALRDAGYRVNCAEDGEEGWQALCDGSFDLLITAHDMPELTGFELLRRVRAGPLRLPVLFISGRMPSERTDFFRWLPPGVALEKPFSLAVLLEFVRDLLAFVPRPVGDRDGQSQIVFGVPSPPAAPRARVVDE